MKKPKWARLIYSPGAVSTFTRNEMSKIVSELSAVANKRLRYFEKKGITYYAEYDTTPDSISGVKRFSAKGKTIGELRAEYKRVSGFLESPISTMSGRKERYYETVRRLSSTNKAMKKQYENMTRAQIEREYTESVGVAYDMFNTVSSLFEAMRKGEWLSKGIDAKGFDSNQWRFYFEEVSYNNRYTDVETLIEKVKKDLGVKEKLENAPKNVGTSNAF